MNDPRPANVTVDRDEILGLLDHVDSLVRFCAVHMADLARYNRGSKAMWAVARRIAGDNEIADRLINEIDGIEAPSIPLDQPDRSGR